jgi:hypothetical protein
MKKRITPVPKGKSKLSPTLRIIGCGSKYVTNLCKSLDPYFSIDLRDDPGPSDMNFHVRTPENIIISVELNHTVQFSEMYLTNRQRVLS